MGNFVLHQVTREVPVGPGRGGSDRGDSHSRCCSRAPLSVRRLLSACYQARRCSSWPWPEYGIYGNFCQIQDRIGRVCQRNSGPPQWTATWRGYLRAQIDIWQMPGRALVFAELQTFPGPQGSSCSARDADQASGPKFSQVSSVPALASYMRHKAVQPDLSPGRTWLLIDP